MDIKDFKIGFFYIYDDGASKWYFEVLEVIDKVIMALVIDKDWSIAELRTIDTDYSSVEDCFFGYISEANDYLRASLKNRLSLSEVRRFRPKVYNWIAMLGTLILLIISEWLAANELAEIRKNELKGPRFPYSSDITINKKTPKEPTGNRDPSG